MEEKHRWRRREEIFKLKDVVAVVVTIVVVVKEAIFEIGKGLQNLPSRITPPTTTRCASGS